MVLPPALPEEVRARLGIIRYSIIITLIHTYKSEFYVCILLFNQWQGLILRFFSFGFNFSFSLFNEFNNSHWSAISTTWFCFQNTCVSAVTFSKTWSKVIKQFLQNSLYNYFVFCFRHDCQLITHECSSLTTCMQIAAFTQRQHFLSNRTNFFRTSFCCLNAFVDN